jgi:hypothetical protein
MTADLHFGGAVVNTANPMPVVDASGSAANTAIGATTDAIADAGGVGTLSAKLRRITQGIADLKTLIVLGAGSAIVGKVGIDQTTPGATNRIHDGWSPILLADVTDNDSDKSFAVPASTEYQPLSILVDLTTSADVGNRQLAVLFTTSADVVKASARARVVQAAGVARRYEFALNVANDTAFYDTDLLNVTLPLAILSAGDKIRIYDSKAIAAAADDMHVQLSAESRAV